MNKKTYVPRWGIIKSMVSRSKTRIYQYEIRLQEEKKNLKRLERSLLIAIQDARKKE